jgi:cation diffusion facilitator family transporter
MPAAVLGSRRGTSPAFRRESALARSAANRVVYAALAGNTLVAATKFVASVLTGSAGMFSEAIHSLVDTGNEVLLLYGIRRAARPANERYPFGQSREIYFWSFVVAILIFALGAGLSLYEGAEALRHPSVLGEPLVNYVVIALAFCFEGLSWVVAYREFAHRQGNQSLLTAIERSKDPRTFLILLEDSAALVGLAFAFAGVFLTAYTGNPVFDAVASLAIGVVLGAVAALLARECKGLLIGEAADPAIVAGIRKLVAADPGIERVNEVLTMQLGPEDVLLNLSLDFRDALPVGEVESCIDEIAHQIQHEFPTVRRVFIEAEAIGRSAEHRAPRHA